jgi:hypothetical protein
MLTPIVKEKVTVIIPFYRADISAYEAIAIEQCYKVLSNYPIIAIKPQSLVLPAEVQKYPFTKILSFDDSFFKGIGGYNALMLSASFYKEFLDYEYMLIHQLDAFVFDDRLSYWCNQHYDYIGAPWLKDCDHPDIIKTVKSTIQYYFHTRYNIQKNGKPTRYQYENRVGNGGFSLRRVNKFYEQCLLRKAEIDTYLAVGDHHFNEDGFWSVEVNRKSKKLNIPGYKTGIKFSVEFAPERAIRLNDNELPFGCHAWDRYADFWRPYFKRYGYDI